MKTLSQDLTNRNWNIDLKAILKNNFHLGIIVLQCHLLCSQLLAGYPDHHQGWHHHQEQHEASAVWSPTSSRISREIPTRSRPAIGLPDKELLIGQVAPLIFRADPRAVVLPPHSHDLLPHLFISTSSTSSPLLSLWLSPVPPQFQSREVFLMAGVGQLPH